MSVSVKTMRMDRLNVDERLALVEEIWATYGPMPWLCLVTNEQRAELDRRVADGDSFSEDLVP